MKRVAVDVMGPFAHTDRGNRYVPVAMDYFTKWPERMFGHFGTAETLHSDRGGTLSQRYLLPCANAWGLKRPAPTPPPAGLVERFNKTLVQQLSSLTSEHQRDWDYHLPLTLMAYRLAVQDSTQCMPALLMLGRELRTPAKLAFLEAPGYARSTTGLELHEEAGFCTFLHPHLREPQLR